MREKNILKGGAKPSGFWSQVKSDFERGLIRWDCIRRSPDYKRAYSEYKNFHCIQSAFMLHPEITSDVLRRLFNRRNIYSLPLADFIRMKREELEFPMRVAIFKNIGERKYLVKTAMDFIYILGFQDFNLKKSFFLSSPIVEQQKIDYEGAMPSKATLTINLAYMEEDVKAAVAVAIDSLYKERAGVVVKKERKDDYGYIRRCLKAHDVLELSRAKKSRVKKTVDTLAEDIYPDSFEINCNSASRKLKRHIRFAKDLISGGYANIK